jgi:hypothetical protein
MVTIDDLIELVERQPEDVRWHSEWLKVLVGSGAEWRDVFRQSFASDPAKWERIEQLAADRGSGLTKLLLTVVGIPLAVRWLEPQHSYLDQRERVLTWLKEFQLDAETWRAMPPAMRRDVVFHWFDTYLGEPEMSSRDLRHLMRMSVHSHRSRGVDCISIAAAASFLQRGYVPAPEIARLEIVAQDAGDEDSVALIAGLIEERRKAWESSRKDGWGPFTYQPDEAGRELLARALELMRSAGFGLAALPPVEQSWETPPLFLAYPELEHEENSNLRREEADRHQYPRRNPERGRPEYLDVEELLGVYRSPSSIVLYERGIAWHAAQLGVDPADLRAVVFLHEVGHWISHKLPHPQAIEWPSDAFFPSSPEVHEGWAQLLTFRVLEQVGGELLATFDKLNQGQSPLYRIYRKLEHRDPTSVARAIVRLRELARPVGFEDWLQRID